MKPIKCFFLQPTQMREFFLRRYVSQRDDCKGSFSYHNARTAIGRFATESVVRPPEDDPRWPAQCECGYAFQPQDNWQLFSSYLFQRSDTQQLVTIEDAPAGAMWFADWCLEGLDQKKVGNLWRGPDGHCLVVKLPDGHHWMVDGQASNCDMKEDKVHKCWVRHGVPPNVTVDKNGFTCHEGAGSIQTPNWHGFLRNGELVS